jgi:Concanavalin A-like lectin/glucanases superfamily
MERTLQRTLLVVALAAALAPAQNQAAVFQDTILARIEVPHSDSLVPTIGLTVEAWVRLDPNGFTGSRAIVVKNSAFVVEAYVLRVLFGDLHFGFPTTTNGLVNLGTNVSLTPNQWHHVAGVFDNSTARLYLDGNLLAQITGLTGPVNSTGPNTLWIGNGADQWYGAIDTVRIWSVARTQSEIQQWKNHAIHGAPGLVSSWNLDGNGLDSTGTNNGSVVGPISFGPGGPIIPHLHAPPTSAVGQPLGFSIDHWSAALTPYVMDISITGTSPGTVYDGILVPLNQPALNFSFGPSLPGMFVNFIGILNAQGHAAPMVNVPALPALAGVTINGAYAILDPLAPQSLDFVSIPSTTLLAVGP